MSKALRNKDNLAVIGYLLTTVNNGYICGFEIVNVTDTEVMLVVTVDNEYKIQPVYLMIEANLYTDTRLKIKTFSYIEGCLVAQTITGLIFKMRVIAIK